MRCRSIPGVFLAGCLLWANPARAAGDEHLRVVEVSLTRNQDDRVQFIEIGDASAEPLSAAGYDLAIFDAAGTLIGGPTLLDRDLLRQHQDAFLVSTASSDVAYGVSGHVRLPTPLPQNGQACIRRIVTGGATEEIHCLAWGTVSAPRPGASRGPAPGSGKSLQSINGGPYVIAPATPKVVNFAVPTDAGTLDDDAGIGLDGGLGAPDPDSGTHDAGKARSSGTSEEETDGNSSGCSTSPAGAGAAPLLVLAVPFVAVAAIARRRRRHGRRL